MRLSAIGDCCHALPVIRTIQKVWPETAVTWIIGATEFRLFEGVEGVEFVVFDKSRKRAAYADIRRELRGRRFPVLLNMHASMRANIASLSVKADLRLGFDRTRARDWQWLFTNRKIPACPNQHVMDGFFEFIKAIGIDERELRWDIPIPDADREFARQLKSDGRPLCVISPCTSQRFRNFRNWAVENYVAAAEALHDRYGTRTVLTGAATELEKRYGSEIRRSADCPVTDLIGQTSLKRLLAVIEAANLLICPDSGPVHMATAVGTPVVGLYATSNPGRTGPYRSQSLVVNEYPQAVQREFGKPVEALRWGTRVRDPDAMDLIRVDSVLEKAALVLESGPETPRGTVSAVQ